MHPHAPRNEAWPLWVGHAVRRLTGYTLLPDHTLDTPASVDRSLRLIAVMPTLTTEQVLAAILVSLVYIKTGDRVTPMRDGLAEVIPMPRLRPLGGDGSYLPE